MECEAKRIAIVGARARTDQHNVVAFVASLPAGVTVVSGGCRGVDTWAAEAARARGLAVVEHRPDGTGVRTRAEAVRRYHERNALVVADADMVVAFVAADRKGGTENTIRHARRAGKPVEIR
jgi:predicted Rossmann fold nucleotide-binding protein DprA/Smf involved in DNA uptake